jgi:hypothetical protein
MKYLLGVKGMCLSNSPTVRLPRISRINGNLCTVTPLTDVESTMGPGLLSLAIADSK